MNSQALGELASDQKIEKVFHAYGYSIPVGKDGRRLWTRKFKNEVGQRMRTGRLSTRDVAKTCGVKHETAAGWKKASEKKASGPHSTLKPKSKPTFRAFFKWWIEQAGIDEAISIWRQVQEVAKRFML